MPLRPAENAIVILWGKFVSSSLHIAITLAEIGFRTDALKEKWRIQALTISLQHNIPN